MSSVADDSVPEHRPLVGFLDDVSGAVVRGWARDEATPHQPAVVEFFVDDEWVGSADADLLRGDLVTANISGGHAAFEVRLPLDPARHHGRLLDARLRRTGVSLGGSPRAVLLEPGMPENSRADAPVTLASSRREAVGASELRLADALERMARLCWRQAKHIALLETRLGIRSEDSGVRLD